jgi:hypothetical protein
MFQQTWQPNISIDFQKVLIIKQAKERAGFMEAPDDINAKKNMSKPTIPPPIANPPKPFKPFVWWTTIKMTAIIKAEAKTSTANINGIGYE